MTPYGHFYFDIYVGSTPITHLIEKALVLGGLFIGEKKRVELERPRGAKPRSAAAERRRKAARGNLSIDS